ncbi:tetratricopeptide repeat protein [Candidatus Dependentiae bacterium]|nr:tetratricopeptide repeat protein [Candidatus Dependentiae bacterium]
MIKNKFYIMSLLIFKLSFASKGIEIAPAQENWGKQANNYLSYLKGSFDYMTGDFDGALLEFENLEKKEQSVYFYDRYIRFLYSTNQFDKIINLDQKIKDSFKDNLEIQKIFAQSYFYTGKGVKADLFLDKLTQKYPQDLQLSYFKAVNFIKKGDLKKALSYIEKCIKNPDLESKHFLFYFLASKVYAQQNNNEKALEYIKKSLELFPDFERGWLLKALIEEQQGKIEQAISGYKRFLDIVGNDQAVEKQLVKLLFIEKRFEEAAKILKQIKNKNHTQMFDLALIEWRSGKPKSALEKLENIIKEYPNFKPAKFLKIEILVSTGQKKSALKLIESWLLDNPDDSATLKVLLLLRRGGIGINHIINVLHKIEQKKPNQLLYFALIDMYFEKFDYKKVLFYCKKLFNVIKDPGLKSKILFQTAYIHFASGNKDKVEKILLTALQYKPTYPSVHNLLAYFYAQNNKNLNKALGHANLALAANPGCYYYIDTKGYVLFKMGKIRDSIKLFEQALRFNPNDEEVLKHLNLAKNFGR